MKGSGIPYVVQPQDPYSIMKTLERPLKHSWHSLQPAGNAAALPSAAPLAHFMPASYHEHAEELEHLIAQWAMGRTPSFKKSFLARLRGVLQNRYVQTISTWLLTCILVFFALDSYATRAVSVDVEDFRKRGMNDAQVINTAAMYAFDLTRTRWWVGDKKPYLALDPGRYYDVAPEILMSMRIEMRLGDQPFRIDM